MVRSQFQSDIFRATISAEDSIRLVNRRLRRTYRNFSHYNRRDPFDEFVFIVCSIRTPEDRYRQAFSDLRERFPNRQQLGRATRRQLAKTLGSAGLAEKKAAMLVGCFDQIIEDFGRLTLSPLRDMSDRDAEHYLTSLPGIGKKAARCIMLYSLDREVFPVDSNCWRIARRMGWVRATRLDRTCGPRDMDRLQDKIPPRLRHSLHVNLVSLGREFCLPRNPRCEPCPVSRFCRRLGTYNVH